MRRKQKDDAELRRKKRQEDSEREELERLKRAQEDRKRAAQREEDERRAREKRREAEKEAQREVDRQRAQDLERAHKAHELAWLAFEASPPPKITMSNVPWPPDNDPCPALVGQAESERKKRFRVLLLRWHSDKFEGNYGRTLDERDRDKVLARVKEITQKLIEHQE